MKTHHCELVRLAGEGANARTEFFIRGVRIDRRGDRARVPREPLGEE